MFTCCPHCKTCFRITKPQLAVAQGKVRCGTCKQVFNGKEHLRDDMPNPAVARAKAEQPKPEPPPAQKPAPIAFDMPAPDSPAAPPAREEIKTDFDIDLDLFSSDESQLMDDEDDSWLDRLDEDDDEDEDAIESPSPRLSEREENELDELFDDEEDEDEDATEIINISDATDDVFASLGIDVDKIIDEKATPEPVDIPDEAEAEKPFPAEAQSETTDHHVAEPASEENTRYEYYDPNELLDEEKGIDEILQEMDAQLSLEIEQPTLGSDSLNIQLPGEGDALFSDGETAKAAADKKQDTENPFDAIANSDTAPEKKDSFETEFLASLDSTLSGTKKPQRAKAKPAAKKTAAKKPPLSYEDDKLTPSATSKTKKDDDIFNFGDTFSGTKNDLPGDDDDIPFQLRDSFEPEEESKIWLKLTWVGGILVLTLALLIQVAVFRSTDIVDNMPNLQPLVSSLCNTFPCRYTGEKDVSQIKLLNRDIRIHPKVKNALLITATMVNRAKFKQPYPDLQISLSDLSGEVVAQRRFSPKEYLGKIQTPFLRMPSGKPVKIALEVIDPGQDAVNFEIRFR